MSKTQLCVKFSKSNNKIKSTNVSLECNMVDIKDTKSRYFAIAEKFLNIVDYESPDIINEFVGTVVNTLENEELYTFSDNINYNIILVYDDTQIDKLVRVLISQDGADDVVEKYIDVMNNVAYFKKFGNQEDMSAFINIIYDIDNKEIYNIQCKLRRGSLDENVVRRIDNIDNDKYNMTFDKIVKTLNLNYDDTVLNAISLYAFGVKNIYPDDGSEIRSDIDVVYYNDYVENTQKILYKKVSLLFKYD